MIRTKKLFVCLALFASILLTLTLQPITYASSAEQDNTVKVGWFPYPLSSEIIDGKPTGYTYDYLMEISKYTGWQYEFVQQDFTTCYRMLAEGEIDIIGGLQITPDRELIYDFSEMPYSHSYLVMFTNNDSALEAYEYENYEGIKIGILKGSSNRENVDKFATENGFTYSIKEYDSNEAIHIALNSKEIDAGVLLSYIGGENTKIIAKFAGMPIHFVTTENNKRITAGINSAMSQIIINNADFESKLYQKYYVKDESVALTRAEIAIVNASQENPILVGIPDGCMPIAYWDNKMQSYTGLTVEIFDAICDKTGLNVKYTTTEMSNFDKGKSEGSPQLVLGVALVEYDPTLYLSKSVLEMPLTIACTSAAQNSWSENGVKIAVVKDFTLVHDYINDKLPNSTIIEYSTLEECFSAIKKGDADATIHFQSSISYYIQKPMFNELKLNQTTLANTNFYVAGYTVEDHSLLNIVDKGYTRISEDELRAITLNATMLSIYPMTFSDNLYKLRLPLIIIVILLISIIAVFIALYSNKRKSNTKLNQAYERTNNALIMAERASEEKGRFTSRMSHEIRTPLNAIIGYNTIARTELAEAKTEAERRATEMRIMDYLSKSEIASKHLLSLINDILDISAIEQGKISIVNNRFDFKGLVASITSIFYSQAKAKRVGFDVEFETHMDEWIIGDQLRVNQILTNLLSNSIKFTPEGGKVTLRISPTTEDKFIKMHFEVADTGIGISREYLERIWTPFEQADTSIVRRFGGSGLGLSITKTLVDLMGGSITVQSTEGKGSSFCVDIAFERTEQPANSMITRDFSSINALIVDDDQSTCDYLRLLFNRCGVRSAAVTSGDDALHAVQTAIEEKSPYTVCLIDWKMPRKDGLETIKDIKAVVGNDMPIIIISAYDFTEIADQASELGVTKFISKPLFQSSLFNMLVDISGNADSFSNKIIPTNDFKGAQVMLVEDNVMNMEIARNILESANITVDCVWNGQEAVNKFLDSPVGTYKAILMDVQMPIMDGLQATTIIRGSEHPEAKSIPIIAMTADAFAENVAECLSAGMNSHISKPIELKTLFATLKDIIKEL